MARFLLQWMEVEQKYRLRKKLNLTCNKTIEKQAFRRIIVELVYLPFVCKHVVKAYFWSVYVLFNVVDRNFSIFLLSAIFEDEMKRKGEIKILPPSPFSFSIFFQTFPLFSLYRHQNFVSLSWHNIFLYNFPGIIFLYSKYNPSYVEKFLFEILWRNPSEHTLSENYRTGKLLALDLRIFWMVLL